MFSCSRASGSFDTASRRARCVALSWSTAARQPASPVSVSRGQSGLVAGGLAGDVPPDHLAGGAHVLDDLRDRVGRADRAPRGAGGAHAFERLGH
jgi:hypothetical protein